MADRAILVVTPEPTSLADAYAMVKVLYKNSGQRLSVLVNMAQSQADAKETFDKLAALVVKFLKRPVESMGFIPYDKQVGVCVRKQSVLSLVSPKSLFSTQMMQCARMLCGMAPASRGGFFGRLFQK
jgi:flagellar biosynthesis protein FlhG